MHDESGLIGEAGGKGELFECPLFLRPDNLRAILALKDADRPGACEVCDLGSERRRQPAIIAGRRRIDWRLGRGVGSELHDVGTMPLIRSIFNHGSKAVCELIGSLTECGPAGSTR
jgi:hypothetical protein